MLTPLLSMLMKKTEGSTFQMLEEDTGFAVCFTTQLSLSSFAFCEKIEAAKWSGLATKNTNARPHAHISCPASVRIVAPVTSP